MVVDQRGAVSDRDKCAHVFTQKLIHGLLIRGVERGRGLVEQRKLRRVDQQPPKREPLLLTETQQPCPVRLCDALLLLTLLPLRGASRGATIHLCCGFGGERGQEVCEPHALERRGGLGVSERARARGVAEVLP